MLVFWEILVVKLIILLKICALFDSSDCHFYVKADLDCEKCGDVICCIHRYISFKQHI